MAVASSHLSDRAQALIRTFRSAFAALDDHKVPAEVAAVYEVIVKHVRSAQPMALLGAADVIEPLASAVVPLSHGARLEVSKLEDGQLSFYMHDEHNHDADSTATPAQAELLVQAVRQVMAGAV